MFILYVCVFALLLTAFICALGSFNQRFEDNLTQRVGLAILGFACVVRAAAITELYTVSLAECLVYLGILIFAIGTLINHKHFITEKPACLRSSKSTAR